MEHIRQAVERAKASRLANSESPVQAPASSLQPQPQQPPQPANAGTAKPARSLTNEAVLNGAHLELNRIISHDIANPRSKSFDVLRTQVLQSMDKKSWQIIGVTSPTPGCGKSVIAINLALSIARQPERHAFLVDMDIQKPQVANYLGIEFDHGHDLVSIIEGRCDLPSAIIKASIRNEQILLLPTDRPKLNSSELMASRAMTTLLQDIRRDFRDYTVIVDLPPILTGDDVLTILPQIDCVVFVTAIGGTTVAEIKKCNKYLELTPIVQVVVNKSTDTSSAYYYYYKSGYHKKAASAAKTDLG